MSILIFIIIISALVVVHELGHFLTAKKFGIRVDEFGLGLPPKAKTLFTWKGTPFTLNWLPFGGFVKIYGENPEPEQSSIRGDAQPDSFQAKNRGIQALVLGAGVVGNLLFAWLLFALGFMIGLPAFTTGEISRLMPHEAFWQALKIVGELTVLITHAIIIFLIQAISGTADLSSVAGPVGIIGLVGDVSSSGLASILAFTAIISINLAVINIMPFPALDGGRILFVIIEAILRRPISPKVFNTVNSLGFAFLIILMVLITIQDVRNIF